MGAPKKAVRHTAAEGRFLTLDDLAAFIQEARRNGAGGSEEIHIADRLWKNELRKVKVKLTPPPDRHPVSAYVETPAEAAEALRRHFGPQDLHELARLLGKGALPARMPPGRQSSTVTRTAVVTYQARGKRLLTLDDLAAFVQHATRWRGRDVRLVEGQAKLVGCGLKSVCVPLEPRPAHLPLTVRLESPATTAAALRRTLRPGDVRELARLLTAGEPVALDPPAAVEGRARTGDPASADRGPVITRRVKVEHETSLSLSLDDVAVFIREARRVGARGGEIVKAGAPPRYHGLTLWNISVEVELPPVDRLIRKTPTDRLTESAEVLRRNLGPDDVMKVAALLTTDDVPANAPPSRNPKRADTPAPTTRKVRTEPLTSDRSLTLGEVSRFIRDALQAGAHGDEIVRDPSRHWQLQSLCIDVELGPLELLVTRARADLPATTAQALRRDFDGDELRELARLLTAAQDARP